MAEVKEAPTDKKPKKKGGLFSSNTKVNEQRLTYIFFGILIVGLIIFTIILFMQKPRKYVATFDDDVTTTIELNEERIQIIVAIGGTEITQNGSLVALMDGEDEVGKFTIYDATLEPMTDEEEEEVVQVKVYDDYLILAYDTGETVTYEKG